MEALAIFSSLSSRLCGLSSSSIKKRSGNPLRFNIKITSKSYDYSASSSSSPIFFFIIIVVIIRLHHLNSSSSSSHSSSSSSQSSSSSSQSSSSSSQSHLRHRHPSSSNDKGEFQVNKFIFHVPQFRIPSAAISFSPLVNLSESYCSQFHAFGLLNLMNHKCFWNEILVSIISC